MKLDGVFAGGGVKAYSFIGALEVIEERGFQFKRLAGTSAGALVAALIQAGYNSHELYQLLDEMKLEDFKDERMSLLPFAIGRWLNLYFRLGLYKGDKLEEWLKKSLEKKGISTFADLPPKSLRIVASDLSKGRIVVWPDHLKDYGIIPERFSVARAVRMSCSIPFFFEPVKIYDRMSGLSKSYIVDGGVLSNFPMWLFINKNTKKCQRPVLGFQLTPQINHIPPHNIRNAFTMYKALFETMSTAHDTRYIEEEHAKNIVFIPSEM